jgi:hypothetical protein
MDRFSVRSLHEFDVTFLTNLYRFPGRYEGGAFCPATIEWDFLDGGITARHGYFGPSWTVIRGRDAVRVCCLFFGIRQPRRLPHKKQEKPLAALLEELSKVPLHSPTAGLLDRRFPASQT